jgi:hypothetical protein
LQSIKKHLTLWQHYLKKYLTIFKG